MTKRKSLEWRNCSEGDLAQRLRNERAVFQPGVLCFLEGEMGAGKSTFAREVLRTLCPDQESRGSPTFPLVHTYRAEQGFAVHHIDLYRIRDEEEFEHSGIAESLDARDALVLVEWASRFPGYFERDRRADSRRSWVQVEIFPADSGNPLQRNYRLTFRQSRS